jgi:hypothetical protein
VRHALLAAAALALFAAPPATAKCCALTTPPAPHDLAAGEEWLAQVELEGDPWPANPPVTVIAWSLSSRRHLSFRARATETPRVYLASVEFPEPGLWRYTVTLGGFGASMAAPARIVTISPAQRAPRALTLAVPGAALAVALALLGRRRLL